MAQEKQPELGGDIAGNQVEEHVSPAAIARHANWELVGKVPCGFFFSLPERELRVPRPWQVLLQIPISTQSSPRYCA